MTSRVETVILAAYGLVTGGMVGVVGMRTSQLYLSTRGVTQPTLHHAPGVAGAFAIGGVGGFFWPVCLVIAGIQTGGEAALAWRRTTTTTTTRK